ncbi:hexokinase [Spirochaetia bacterium]|nr:hexokinase [Spirochaetia bacterium]
MKQIFNPSELADFARYYGFHYDCCDPETLIRDFCIDMERGLSGQSSGMPMLPSHIYLKNSVPPGKKALALDAGGTNLRAAVVSFGTDGKPVVQGLRNAAMPGTTGRLSASQFYDELAGVCAPLLEEYSGIEGVGFCFSYPMETTEDGDAIPFEFTKEVDAPDVAGKPVGKSLRDALARRGVKAPEHITLLNDTTATLLTGLAQIPPNIPSKIEGLSGSCTKQNTGGAVIGFILGTGFNTAYPETVIKKINFESKTSPQIVVCESGNFYNRYQGVLDREFDAATKNPGAYSTEKMSAGAYLGLLSLHILKRAVGEGVLKFKKSTELLAMNRLGTKDLNAFLNNPLSFNGALGDLFSPDETDAISSLVYLESIITERAAVFSAATLAAVIQHTGEGKDQLKPVRIAVDGTTFAIYHFMRESIEAHLRVMLNASSPHFFIMSKVEQASLLGAAVAAL